MLLVSIDEITADPDKTIIEVEYSANKDQGGMDVSLTFAEYDIKTAWGKRMATILPVTDRRIIKGGKQITWRDRTAWLVDINQ